jgi:uncharacterized membrane protein YgcG
MIERINTKQAIFIVILACITACVGQGAAGSAIPRDFPAVDDRVEDFAGVLTEDQVTALIQGMQHLIGFNEMPGVIVIQRHTSEWDFDEYCHDLFDRLMAKGLVNNSGFLIYISVDDRKLSFVMGHDLERVTDPERVREIRGILGAALAKDEYFKGLTDTIAQLRLLGGPVELDEARRLRGQYLMLAGFLVIIAALVMNISKKRKKLKRRT